MWRSWQVELFQELGREELTLAIGAMFGAWPLETAGVVMEYPRAPKRKRGGSWLARLFSR